jgi:hypothetical protein
VVECACLPRTTNTGLMKAQITMDAVPIASYAAFFVLAGAQTLKRCELGRWRLAGAVATPPVWSREAST